MRDLINPSASYNLHFEQAPRTWLWRIAGKTDDGIRRPCRGVSVFLLFTSFASASPPYDVELAVPSIHPSWVDAKSLYGASRIVAETENPNVTVASSHPAVTCEIEDGLIIVGLSAEKADYPTSFPFTATCSYSGETLNIEVVTYSVATDPSLQPPLIDANTDTITLKRNLGAHVVQTYDLPHCADEYKNGTYQATLSGVYCKVEDMIGKKVMRLHVTGKATMGTGSCDLDTANGPSVTVGLDLSEASI